MNSRLLMQSLAKRATRFIGVRWGALANNVTAVLKLAGLVAFALLAPLLGEGSVEHLRPLAESDNLRHQVRGAR